MKAIHLYSAVFVVSAFLPVAVAAQEEGKFFQTVIANATKCTAGKVESEVISCYVKATPAKCEAQVYEFFARHGDNKSEARRAWYYCIESCADAGFWSRSFGDCVRKIK